MYSFFVYNSVLLLSVLFAYLGSNLKANKKTYIFFSFILLFSVSALRFDVGYDYDNYARAFKKIYSSNVVNVYAKDSYGLYDFICQLFGFSKKGYIYVFALYSFFTLFFIYKTLIYRNILPLGLFFLICLNFLFISYDQIRQFLSISIFVYSVKFIEKKEFKNYLVYILIATVIHSSALIVLPFYFFRDVRSRFMTSLAVVIVFVIGFYMGTWEGLREQFYAQIPFYSFYLESQESLKSVKLNSNIGVAYLLVISVLSLWFLNKNKEHLFFYTTVLGVVIYLFASNNLNIYRAANYFLIFQCVSIPLIIKRQKQLFSGITLFFITTAFVMFQMNIINSPRGTTPYQTILSNHGMNENFHSK